MKPLNNRGFSVTLVGRRCSDSLNLGLGYLSAALKQAGFSVQSHVLNDWRQMEGICRKVRADEAGLVGLSISDGGSAFLPLGLGELLRRTGYAGHITCGGPFATLARKWLLERYGWLDSVVRFAGEVPITALAERIRGNRAFEDVSGLTTRSGDGVPHPVCDRTPMTTVPDRDCFPEILGYPMTHIAATRGCAGTCAYCGPYALLSLERREGRRAGFGPGQLACAGVGKVRRRPVDLLCDEMAGLWHDKGVRYFYFVDEHMLPYEEDEALAFLEQWKEGLARRSVGSFGVGTMLRVDRITERVAEAFADAGLVRVFLGIEFGTAAEARRFARRTDLGRVSNLVAAFQRLGVAIAGNVMLVHPYSTVDTVESGLGFMESLPAGVFQATKMMVYHGTRLHARMERENRLLGNPLRYAYTHLSPTVDGFAGIFQRLRTEAFGDYSLVFRAHDAALALALARRLHPGLEFGDLGRRMDRTIRSVNELNVRAFRSALALARRGKGFDGCSGLVEDVRKEAAGLVAELDRIARAVPARIRRPGAVFAPMRAAAVSALKFAVVGTAVAAALGGTAGCSEGVNVRGRGPNQPASAATAPARAETARPGRAHPAKAAGAGRDQTSRPASDGSARARADEPVRECTDPGPDARTSGAPTPSPAGPSAGPKVKVPLCTVKQERAEKKQVVRKIKVSDKCFSGSVLAEETGSFRVSPASLRVSVRYGLGIRTSLKVCDNAAMRHLLGKKKAKILSLLQGRTGRCRWRYDQQVYGLDHSNLVKLRDVLTRRCRGQWAAFTILVDSDGTALPIGPSGKKVKNHPAARCIRKALRGLKFPCLAGHQICPVSEHVIIE